MSIIEKILLQTKFVTAKIQYEFHPRRLGVDYDIQGTQTIKILSKKKKNKEKEIESSESEDVTESRYKRKR